MPAEFPEGSYIDRYRVLRLLGSGGFSRVYQVIDEDLERKLAIKVLHHWGALNDSHLRFEREAKVLSQLLHPNIVRVYRFGLLPEGTPFLVMELLEGDSLRFILEKRKRLPCHEAISIAEQVASALEYAQSLKVVHRDLKPENVVIAHGIHGMSVKLLDFGLCKQVDDEKTAGRTFTETGSLVGTVQYMSPEQCMGSQLDFRSDIYSFGCVLFEMITGDPPFSADTPAAVFLLHTSKPLPKILEMAPDCGLPQELENLLEKCCRKNADERYFSFAELSAALREIGQLGCTAVFDPSRKASVLVRARRCLSRLPAGAKLLLFSFFTVILLFFCGMAYFLAGTDKGNALMAVELQSRMSAGAAADSLSKQVRSLIRSGKAEAAIDLAEATIRNTRFQVWPPECREKLLSNYIVIFKEAKMDSEAFSLSLSLLQELLDGWIRSVEWKTGMPNIALLDRLSKELAETEHSKKDWTQIYQVIDQKRNAFKRYSGRMAWTGYLHCLSGLKRGAAQTENNPVEQARLYDCCLSMALANKDPVLTNKVITDYSAFNLKHHLFDFESMLHTSLGLQHALDGKMDLAANELAVAENFEKDAALSPVQRTCLEQLSACCRQGRYVGNTYNGRPHETNVKWLLKYVAK